MSSPMNFVVRSYLRKWNKELSDIRNNPWRIQSLQLTEIINSRYVRAIHGEQAKIESYEEFKETIPIQFYDDIKEKILEFKSKKTIRCEYFAQSSGTSSGERKLIPTPEIFVKRNHLRGSWYILHTLYQHDREMSVFKSKNLLIGGSIYHKSDSSTVGDVSGIMLNRIPRFFRPWYVPSIKTAVHPDWKFKLEQTAKEAARTKNIALLGGTPTWVLAVLRMILQRSGKENLTEIWPGLKAYIHGGVNFEPYRNQFKSLIQKEEFRYTEVYNASEGFFAFQDRPVERGMLLMCASGVFFEFIEWQDFRNGIMDAHSIAEVCTGEDYVMVISSINGLLRYVLGDLVRFVTIAPFRIIVTGRIKEYINAFGEDLALFQVEEALKEINAIHQVHIRDFSIAPKYLNIEKNGYHFWFIEFYNEPEDPDLYARDLDRKLCDLNSNYAQKRYGQIALDPLKIFKLNKGTVDKYFQLHSVLGGQSKLPKMSNDSKILDRLYQIHHAIHQDVVTS